MIPQTYDAAEIERELQSLKNRAEVVNYTPSLATSPGRAGTVAWDDDYIYICTATDTWKRVAISTWP